MPESKNNTRGQVDAPKSFLDDYLPDYSPRPKYVIATIYPPSSEPLVTPDSRPVNKKGEPPVPVQPSHETVSMATDAGHHNRPGHGVIDTGWRESSLGMPYDRVAGSGSGSGDTLLRSPIAIETAGHLPESSSRAPEASAKERLPLMELPRGSFRSLERNASLISLLHNLSVHAFRGSCRINRNGSTILLVFDQGKIILAEYDDLAGDAALDMICTHRFARVDAIISDLDDAQIRLSLEFNPSWKVQGEQEPSCIVSPEKKQNAGRKLSLPEEPVHEPEPGKYPEPASGSEIRFVRPGAGSPDNPDESLAVEDTSPAISVYAQGEPVPGEQVGLPAPDNEDTPDWRTALTMPVISSRDDPVPSTLPESGMLQIRGEEADWRNALTASRESRRSGEVIVKSSEKGCPEDPGNIEGWKKALNIPVIPALPEEKSSSEQVMGVTNRISAVISDFEPLSADSVLFDDIPAAKKMPGAPAPEPAEQWRSMGMNRGENSSV